MNEIGANNWSFKQMGTFVANQSLHELEVWV